ncbi:hypothetical protein SAMN05192555_109101 [Franzmannia pantelleriensis]|uniref:Uncharacterized protein n=1 Tax=Franzmannia pantelleriensis TaxID=48727 RepID=A0A1G9QDZ4_9GAMM|nr:hypothetical protein [Halomonas pantelleriensis]SDM09302.1 hypothetical protein SAMN05192555_109101 [Halomonas pantelleriensis]
MTASHHHLANADAMPAIVVAAWALVGGYWYWFIAGVPAMRSH